MADNLSQLEVLPDSLLQHSILASLDRTSLGRLACCSRHLSRAAVTDQLWFPVCRGIGELLSQHDWRKLRLGNSSGSIAPPPPYPWKSWHQLFCYKQNRRCVKCREHTSYVFTLSESHFPLCERCEHACPEYALVTELEAKGRYLLTDNDLSGLLFKKICFKRFCVYFFLKLDIERVSARWNKISESRGNNTKIKWEDAIDKEEVVDVAQFEEVFGDIKEAPGHRDMGGNGEGSSDVAYEAHEVLQLSTEFTNLLGLSDEETEGGGSSLVAFNVNVVNELDTMPKSEDTDERARKRELRKEHKRQVKAAKKEKLFLSSSPENRRDILLKNVDGVVAKKNVTSLGRQTMELNAPSVLPVGSTHESPDANKQGKLKKRRTKREHVVAAHGGFRHDEIFSGDLQWKKKSHSGWVREREWLEVELGPYGLSALELAPYC